MLLAFDDTDSVTGGCTTYAAFQVLLALPELALGGMPRLVRLNPNWPQKTRGNGAVVLPLVHPGGPRVQVGELLGHEVRAFPEGAPVTVDEARRSGWLETAWSALRSAASPDARPGMVACDTPPVAAAYGLGVTTELTPEEAGVAAEGAWVRGGDGPGGWIGAVAAAAWPGPPASFEFLAYRAPTNWGTPRRIDPADVVSLDASGATFHSHDPASDTAACIPSTPCPVLCGLRGLEAERLQQGAVAFLRARADEPVAGWLLWATNQASGDHIVPVDVATDAPRFSTVRLRCEVVGPPRRVPGGHAIVPVSDRAGARLEAVAFEATGALRKVVDQLVAGDVLSVVGRLKDGSVHLERLDVLDVAEGSERRPPVCACGTGMRSRGRGAGFRCPSCHERAPEDAGMSAVARRLVPGSHEPDVRARRHLHRPAAWDLV